MNDVKVSQNEDYLKAMHLFVDIVKHFERTKEGRLASVCVSKKFDIFDTDATSLNIDNAVKYFLKHIEPHLSGSNTGRYLGFITGTANPAALLGDWVSAIYNQNVIIDYDSIASMVERLTIKKLLKLFNMRTDGVEGSFVTGSTVGNFSSFLLARQWAGKFYDIDVAETGASGFKFLVVCNSAHSSFYKSLAMAGHGRKNIINLNACNADNLIFLENLLSKEPGTPIFYVTTAGDVNFPYFDNFAKLKILKEKHSNLWIHIDAAYGIYLSLLDDWSDKLAGVDIADSLVFDCHKMLNTPFDSAVFCTSHPDLRVEVFKNTAPYLPECDKSTKDFLHLGPENSRRFRALPVYFTILSYGSSGIAKMVKKTCELGMYFSLLIENEPRLSLLEKDVANIVVFSIKDDAYGNGTQLVQIINKKGDFFLTPTVFAGVSCCRVAFCSWQTTHQHVNNLFIQIKSFLDK